MGKLCGELCERLCVAGNVFGGGDCHGLTVFPDLLWVVVGLVGIHAFGEFAAEGAESLLPLFDGGGDAQQGGGREGRLVWVVLVCGLPNPLVPGFECVKIADESKG